MATATHDAGAAPGATGPGAVERGASVPPASTTGRREELAVLWSFVRPHRRVVAVGVVLGLVSTAGGLATPLVARNLLDGLASQASVAGPVGLLVALLVLGSVLSYAQSLLLGRLAEDVVLDARGSMVRRLLRADVAALAHRSPGELVTRVTSDTVLMRQAAAGSATSLVNSVVGIVGALALMAFLDLVLLATTVTALSWVVVTFVVLMPRLRAARESAQAALGELGGGLEGALRAIRTVKASRAEGYESDRVLERARESARENVRAVRIEALAGVAAGSGIQLAILAILAVGAWRVGEGALGVSSLVAFLLYAFALMGPIATLTQAISQLQSGTAAAVRIRQIQDLDVEDTGTDQDDGGTPQRRAGTAFGLPDSLPRISFRDVSVTYAAGTPDALTGLTVDIPRIGHTAVVGPSGAGKTTIFSLLLKLLQPRTGDIYLDGVAYGQLSPSDVRSRVAYVEQDTPLLTGTLRENLRYARRDADESALWDALEAVRLVERVAAWPDGLDTVLSGAVVSGGERQRIAIARALVSDPEILLLDEVTAQLDGLTEHAVQRAIARIASRGAVVTIAHRLSTVIDADRILLVEGSRLRAQGTHTELLASDELYRSLVAALRIGPVESLEGPARSSVHDETVPSQRAREEGSTHG